MAERTEKTCGNCVRFRTDLCTCAYSSVPTRPPKPKILETWKEFIDRVYDPLPAKPCETIRVSNWNIILPSDIGCLYWEEK